MKSKFFFPVLLLVAIFLSSCGDSQVANDAVLKSIPQDVSMVTAIDAGAILEKADFQAVKQMDFYQEMIDETKRYNATLGAVLSNPETSGIDLNQNIYIAHHFDPENPEDVFVAIVAVVSDQSALEQLIKSNEKFKISKQGDINVAMKGSQSVAWNGERVLMGMTNSYSDPLPKIEKFFTTTPETSIAGDSDLKKAMSGAHDVTSWFSSNALAKSKTLKNGLLLAGINADALKDNFIHSYVDFKNGEIKGESDLFLQSALMDDINLFFKDKVVTDFSSYIPADASSVMAVALDFEGVQQALMKRPMFAGMADHGLKEYGLSLSDIASTFAGDILLYSAPGSGEGLTPGSFATSINNQENLSKFLDLAIDYRMLTKVSDELYTINNTGLMAQGAGDAQLLIQDDMIFISGDAAIMKTIRSGGFKGGDRIDKSKIKNVRSNILSGFMDYGKLLKSIPKAKDLDLKVKDLNFTTNRKNGSFDLNFKEQNTNGLKQLFESINEAYLAEKRGEI